MYNKFKMKKVFSRLSVFSLGFALALGLGLGRPSPAFAISSLVNQVVPGVDQVFQGADGVRKNFSTVDRTINTVVRVVVAVSSAIFLIMLVIGGVNYLSAGGNEEAVGKAKKTIFDAIIGLMITLSAWGISWYLFSQLGITGQGVGEYQGSSGGGPSKGPGASNPKTSGIPATVKVGVGALPNGYTAIICVEPNFIVGERFHVKGKLVGAGGAGASARITLTSGEGAYNVKLIRYGAGELVPGDKGVTPDSVCSNPDNKFTISGTLWVDESGDSEIELTG